MAKITEDSIQFNSYMWFNNTYKELRGCLFAVPNGGARGGLEGKILKMTGTYSGVSDMIFLYNKRAYLLETKNEFGVLSENQIKWKAIVEKQGFSYFVFRDLETFQKIIIDIIAGKYEL